MALPLTYNVRSVRVRWRTSLAAVAGIAGTVGVFVAVLALANGFRAALVEAGAPENVLVRRAGATSEMDSAVSAEELHVVEELPGVARDAEGALASPEVVVVAAFPFRATGTDGNPQVRGVTPRALRVHPRVKITQGRAFTPGLNELMVGGNAHRSYRGLDLGGTVDFGGQPWTIVGLFDAGGSAFDSEIWCDASVLNGVYQRPSNVFQSVAVRLTAAAALEPLRKAMADDPRLRLQAERERDYYAKMSEGLSRVIRGMGMTVALVMGLGAILGALNTMFAATADRAREIATLRAIGFGRGAVVVALVLESVLLALAGGVAGGVAVLPINGLTTGTMNWVTFSHLSFAFRVTPAILLQGLAFAALMGILGGLPPALRAARLPVATALREM